MTFIIGASKPRTDNTNHTNMKPFLVEIKATPNNVQRTQYAHSLASLAIMAENGGLQVQSLRELTEDEREAYDRSGMQSGLQDIEQAATADTRPYTGRNVFGYACPKGSLADVSK